MSVLVIGASGYIGFAVSQVLRQHVYFVYGLVRKPDLEHKLASNEIFPVAGEVNKPESYTHIIQKVNIVIDTTPDPQGNSIVLAEVKKHSTPSHGKKVLIFTSGILVHGHSDEVQISEENIKTPPFLQKRADFEAAVIQSTEIHGIVIRPGFVYGYAGGNGGTHLGETVFELPDGKITISGSTTKRWSWVHVHDLANAYLLAVQKFTIASGQIFNVAGENPPTYEEFRKKAAQVAGHKNAPVATVPIPAGNPWAPILEVSVRIAPIKARNLLGWNPTHLHVLDDLEPVYATYLALKNKK